MRRPRIHAKSAHTLSSVLLLPPHICEYHYGSVDSFLDKVFSFKTEGCSACHEGGGGDTLNLENKIIVLVAGWIESMLR